MTTEEFTKALEAEFEDITPGTITPDTDYRTIKGWSSMHALIVIAFADTQFDVLLTGSDLKSTNTFRDLHKLIEVKTTA
jgi:acyl carrier protein